MFHETLEKNILQENGSKMFSKLFGERNAENSGIKAELLSPVSEVTETKLAKTWVTELKNEVTSWDNANPDTEELEDAFFDMSKAPLCSANTQDFLKKTQNIIIPSWDTYQARGMDERSRPLVLSSDQAKKSEEFYRNRVTKNNWTNPSEFYYNTTEKDPVKSTENALNFIKRKEAEWCRAFDVRVTWVSTSWPNVWIGHRFPIVEWKDSKLRWFDRVVRNFRDDSDWFDPEEYWNWIKQRSNQWEKAIAILWIAAFN